jgi:hypothetical protein
VRGGKIWIVAGVDGAEIGRALISTSVLFLLGGFVQKRGKMMRKQVIGALALGLACGLSAGAEAGSAPVVYREVFPNDTGGTQGDLAATEGWKGGQHDNPILNPPDGQISVSTGATEMTAVNSKPVGSTTNTGFLFYSPDQRAGVYNYTQEYSLRSDDLRKVKWDSRNNTGTDNPIKNNDGSVNEELMAKADMHLVFQVDSSWYVSDQGFQHQGDNSAWTNNKVDVSGLTYGLFDRFKDENTDLLPRRTSTAALQSGLNLPSGTIDTFGIYVNKNFGTVRLDNYTLKAVPTPSAIGGGLLMLGGLVMRRGRQHA